MKRVIIVGASSGLGYGLAEALASRGVRVGLAARHTEKLRQLQEKYPESVVCRSIDITKRHAATLLGELIAETGGMDIYIHAAGIGTMNPELDPELEADVVRTNATGFARCVSAAFNWMRSNGVKGQIAAITSVAAGRPMGPLSAYSSAKKFDQWYLWALEQVSNNTGAGITFTDIRPGWVRTPLVHDDQDYPMEMTVEEVVPLMIEAIVRKRRVAVINWKWALMIPLWKMIPVRLWVHMKMTLSKPKA